MQVSYYPSMDYGIDTNRTFEMKDLLIFTDNLEVKSLLPQLPLMMTMSLSNKR